MATGTRGMKVRIADLPEDVSEHDIRELLEHSEDIQNVELIHGDEAGPKVAIVELASDTVARAVVEVVNGHNWRGATLRADELLY